MAQARKGKQKGKQATWGGRFKEGPSALMQDFSESVSFDKRLAPFDILGSQAHAAMLAKVGILSESECKEIIAGLENILEEVMDGSFRWDKQLEDVHMNIEQVLTKRVPAAARLHTARSRNDQVATDIRLYLKWACEILCEEIKGTMYTLVQLSEKNQNIYIPGYTHLQRAQPVSVAHHLLAYVEMLSRDHRRFEEISEHTNYSPLGSGAIAGTTLPINREFSAQLLCFLDSKGKPQVTTNSMDAVSDRDSLIEFANACALVGIHLSRLSEDIILWNSSEFKFIRLPDSFTTGSSLMPQKKNPDCFELIRGKSARLIGNANMLMTMVKGLPLTYNRDLQEDKPPVFDSFDQTVACLKVASGALKEAFFDKESCARAVEDPLLLATDLADFLVNQKVPFREAHHLVGQIVALSEQKNTPLNKLTDADVLAIDKRFGKKWRDVFNLQRAMKNRENTGMPGPQKVKEQILRWKTFLEKRN